MSTLDQLEFARVMLRQWKKRLKRSRCKKCRAKVIAQVVKWRRIVTMLEAEHNSNIIL